MPAKRRLKREAEIGVEYAAAIEDGREEALLEAKGDAQLFFVDTVAKPSRKQRKLDRRAELARAGALPSHGVPPWSA